MVQNQMLGSVTFFGLLLVAVTLSVLFCGIVFGLGHGGTLEDRFLVTGLLMECLWQFCTCGAIGSMLQAPII